MPFRLVNGDAQYIQAHRTLYWLPTTYYIRFYTIPYSKYILHMNHPNALNWGSFFLGTGQSFHFDGRTQLTYVYGLGHHHRQTSTINQSTGCGCAFALSTKEEHGTQRETESKSLSLTEAETTKLLAIAERREWWRSLWWLCEGALCYRLDIDLTAEDVCVFGGQ